MKRVVNRTVYPKEPIGMKEIGEMLDVHETTVWKWKQRDLLPDSHWTVSGRPAWPRNVIEKWARDTGRL